MGNEQSAVSTATTASSFSLNAKRRESVSVTQRSTNGLQPRANGHQQRRMSTCGVEFARRTMGDDEPVIGKHNEVPPLSPPPLQSLLPLQSPRKCAFRTSRPQSQQLLHSPDHSPPITVANHPLTPFPSLEPRRVGSIPSQPLATRRLLAPTSGVCRNRRMSVAGDQQEALRRELARAEGRFSPMSTHSAGNSTPAHVQQRFTRATSASTNGSGSAAARKISELGAGPELSVHELLKLSSYQLQILQQSWPRIRSSAVFTNAFKDLIRKNAMAKEMFQKMSIVEGFCSSKCCDQKEHGRQLSELFDFAVQHLNGPVKIVQQKCHLMGEQHFSVFGSCNEAQMWDDLGECICQAMAKAEPVRGKREAFRAWITLINFLVESMRTGYLQQFKRRSMQRHSSSSQLVVQLATLEEHELAGDCGRPASATMRVAGDKRALTPTAPLSALKL